MRKVTMGPGGMRPGRGREGLKENNGAPLRASRCFLQSFDVVHERIEVDTLLFSRGEPFA